MRPRTELAGRFHDDLVALSIGWKPPRGKNAVMNSVYLRFMQASPESLYHLAELDVNTIPPEDALPAGVLVRVPLPRAHPGQWLRADDAVVRQHAIDLAGL